jgi:nucleotide-binding universal stress UspA family protein
MENIVICADINQASLDTLKKMKHSFLFENTTIHILHVFEVHMYNADLVPVIFPAEVQYPDIEASALGILRNLSNELKCKENQTNIKCFFSHSREEKIISYLNEVKADLVVVATRGKHGLEGFFNSSLADFLSKYSPCDVLVVRPKAPI